jgi:hypothetical protein
MIKKSLMILLFLSLSLSLLYSSSLLYSMSSQLFSVYSDFSEHSITTSAFAQSTSNNKSIENNNSNNNSNITSPDFRTYVNPSSGISLQYPSAWEAIELKTSMSKTPSGSLALLLSPLENASDTYREKLLVSMQNLGSKNMTLDEYTQHSINEYRNQSNNNNKIHIIESSPTTLSGNPAYRIVFTESFEGHQLKKMQIWSIINNKVYLIIFSAEESKYDSHLPDVLKTFNSFKIFNPMVTTANLNHQQQQNLTYEDFGINLQYPASWIKVQHSLPLLSFRNNFTFFFVEFISRPPTSPPSTINLGMHNLPSKNIELAQYSANIINFITKNGGKLVETANTKVGGNLAQKVVYILGNSTKIMYVWTIKGDKAYHFIYRSNVKNYQADLSTVNSMLNSIQLK